MNLHEGPTYWDKTLVRDYQFEKLERDLKTKNLIIGGGMSGTLAAYALSSEGEDVTLIEKDKIGKGSSTANTGLLQYCSDKMLSELAEEIGEEKAVLFYQMCLESMDHLTKLQKQLDKNTDYRLRESIYYASDKKDVAKLKKEYGYLKKYDFPVEFLDRERLKAEYKIDKDCALRTWHDADVNPYKLIYSITDQNLKNGVKYYENTEIDLNHIEENYVYTQSGQKVYFENLILTTGYTKLYPAIKNKASINRTYAFSSKPINGPTWNHGIMVWETKNPYLYFRTTVDNRIIAGGLDEEKNSVSKDEEKIYAKAQEIKRQIEDIFPHLQIDIQYYWNALFGSSEDGLPFIGRDPIHSNIYYLLGYEGNGTCYSMAGALIIKDLIKGTPNIYSEIVKVDRQ